MEAATEKEVHASDLAVMQVGPVESRPANDILIPIRDHIQLPLDNQRSAEVLLSCKNRVGGRIKRYSGNARGLKGCGMCVAAERASVELPELPAGRCRR